ncbi:hypothetical protein TNCT_711541 [Trichonephila clavata]|uniref:Uncharacterized protein n=1 Tax=Trichonephila clavata TaxID=2740835 RepID=A0A8X6KYN7_TRICU|nr:hypothetical protein TNCT_711541 [Trichonephila clavata]
MEDSGVEEICPLSTKKDGGGWLSLEELLDTTVFSITQTESEWWTAPTLFCVSSDQPMIGEYLSSREDIVKKCYRDRELIA